MTIRNKSARQNSTTALLSIITCGARPIAAVRAGSATARRPSLVSSQIASRAPAARNRDVSVLPLSSRSSRMPKTCSSRLQEHPGPFTGHPDSQCGLIFTAVHSRSSNARIRSTTNAVLPILRHCPPTTTRRPPNGGGCGFQVTESFPPSLAFRVCVDVPPIRTIGRTRRIAP